MDNQTQLSVTDLTVIKDAINLACARGAFRAEEMRTVGEAYDKLTAFLKTIFDKAEAEIAQANQLGETQ